MPYTISDTDLKKLRKQGARFIRINDTRLEELAMWGKWITHSKYANAGLVEEGLKFTMRTDPGMVLVSDGTHETQ